MTDPRDDLLAAPQSAAGAEGGERGVATVSPLLSFPIRVDPSMPPGAMLMVNAASGAIVGGIINMAPQSKADDPEFYGFAMFHADGRAFSCQVRPEWNDVDSFKRDMESKRITCGPIVAVRLPRGNK